MRQSQPNLWLHLQDNWTSAPQDIFQVNGFPTDMVRKTLSQKPHFPVELPLPLMQSLPYVRGLSEGIESVCTPLGIKAALKLMGTVIQCLVIVKTRTPAYRRKGIAYKECGKCYIWETQRTLKVSLGVNKQAVKSGDSRKGIAVHAHESTPPLTGMRPKLEVVSLDNGSEGRVRPWTWTAAYTF